MQIANTIYKENSKNVKDLSQFQRETLLSLSTFQQYVFLPLLRFKITF